MPADWPASVPESEFQAVCKMSKSEYSSLPGFKQGKVKTTWKSSGAERAAAAEATAAAEAQAKQAAEADKSKEADARALKIVAAVADSLAARGPSALKTVSVCIQTVVRPLLAVSAPRIALADWKPTCSGSTWSRLQQNVATCGSRRRWVGSLVARPGSSGLACLSTVFQR